MVCLHICAIFKSFFSGIIQYTFNILQFYIDNPEQLLMKDLLRNYDKGSLNKSYSKFLKLCMILLSYHIKGNKENQRS